MIIAYFHDKNCFVLLLYEFSSQGIPNILKRRGKFIQRSLANKETACLDFFHDSSSNSLEKECKALF